MPNTNHLLSLKQRHNHVEQVIHAEQTRPLPNFGRLGSLKREKLRVKDLIAKFSHP